MFIFMSYNILCVRTTLYEIPLLKQKSYFGENISSNFSISLIFYEIEEHIWQGVQSTFCWDECVPRDRIWMKS